MKISKALLVLQAMLLTTALVAIILNMPSLATALMISSGIIVVAEKWRQ
jgi:hypothetical protein